MKCLICGNKTVKKVKDELLIYKGQKKNITDIVSFTCNDCEESFYDPQSDELLDKEFKKLRDYVNKLEKIINRLWDKKELENIFKDINRFKNEIFPLFKDFKLYIKNPPINSEFYIHSVTRLNQDLITSVLSFNKEEIFSQFHSNSLEDIFKENHQLLNENKKEIKYTTKSKDVLEFIKDKIFD